MVKSAIRIRFHMYPFYFHHYVHDDLPPDAPCATFDVPWTVLSLTLVLVPSQNWSMLCCLLLCIPTQQWPWSCMCSLRCRWRTPTTLSGISSSMCGKFRLKLHIAALSHPVLQILMGSSQLLCSQLNLQFLWRLRPRPCHVQWWPSCPCLVGGHWRHLL